MRILPTNKSMYNICLFGVYTYPDCLVVQRFSLWMLYLQGDVWICMEVMDASLDKFYQTVFKTGDCIPEDVLAKITYAVSASRNKGMNNYEMWTPACIRLGLKRKNALQIYFTVPAAETTYQDSRMNGIPVPWYIIEFVAIELKQTQNLDSEIPINTKLHSLPILLILTKVMYVISAVTSRYHF